MTTDYKQSDMHAGLYVHIPFCAQKCPYCDFYSITDLSMMRQFANALFLEMEMVRHTPLVFDTIYIGGGSPSILDGNNIALILEAIHRLFIIHPNPEITMEINPGTVDLNKLKLYKTSGVNRLNIGVQSFNNASLKFLGRIHSSNHSKSVFYQSRNAGFDNIGIDLIYGLPGQTQDSWILDLQTAIDFKPEHLSCYMLSYEEHTDMWRKLKHASFHPLPEKQVANLFKITIEFLENNGYTHYEISNFAKSSSDNLQDNSSKHNQKYWSSTPYLGLGPSAHSFMEPKRFWNVRSVKKYMYLLSDDKLPVEEEEVLTDGQMMTEAIYLGLRKTVGIDINAYNQKFNVSFTSQFKKVINELINEEVIYIDEQRCRLSRKGMLFLDSIAPMFMDNVP